MIPFSQYLAESLDKDYAKFLRNMADVGFITDRTSLYIDKPIDMIYAGIPVAKYFAPFDKKAAQMAEFAKRDKAGKWKAESQQALKMADKYEMIKERYLKYAECFAKVLGCLSKGDKTEDAIKKLVKFAASHKYYDLEQGKYTVKFFDNVNEKDILFQIEKYAGVVKLNGPIDFMVHFRNGKVTHFYF